MRWSRHELIVCVAFERNRETLEAIAFRQRSAHRFWDVENRDSPHAMQCEDTAMPNVPLDAAGIADRQGSDVLARRVGLEFDFDDPFPV